MYQGTYKIANHTIHISSKYEEIQLKCSNYSTKQEPEVYIQIEPEEIEFEAKECRKVQLEEIGLYAPLTDSQLEVQAIHRKLAKYLLNQNVLLFHASAVAVDGQCYLFTAKSGTGKSTHTNLWRKLLGSKAVMVNDDKPMLGISPNGITVYGTPWDGKHHLSSNIAVPLKAICIVTRGPENQIVEISAKEALNTLVVQSFIPEDSHLRLKQLDLIDQICKQAKFYVMACNMELDAAKMSYNTMSAG